MFVVIELRFYDMLNQKHGFRRENITRNIVL
jgi:hypothetical protein